ncbi:cytochrome C oxidase subunit IV family protein [Rhizosphaericola mali]|uniref:Cytochrome C oxidase subunit IV family protein n=1 Tax=Rhizosphaericola mali TaxID=2545455 RepID=A0A5P2G5I6_9BACT|nr:cytochrome C oxidase subunit IV family protein [Rhizosphaericola mali]QES90467.1 cytochrome C oxidase subunit IV family protein [Rhizosphaericola mali]
METTVDLHGEGHHEDGKKMVIKITILLSVITIIELILGFIMMPMPEGSFSRHFIKGIIIVLMLWKAYYITGYFMHLKHENGVMKKLILIPLSIFVWFIIAFLADGASYLHLRKTYDPYSLKMNSMKAPQHEEGAEHHSPTEE